MFTDIGGYWIRSSAIIASTKTGSHPHSLTSSSTTSLATSTPTPSVSSSVAPISTSTPVVSSSTPSSTSTSTVTVTLSTPSTLTGAASGTAPTTTMKPSLLSTITTSLTAFSTVTSAVPQDAIFSSIRGLNECTQQIIFDKLAGSKCNPANFPCICNELRASEARPAVEKGCKETSQYDEFEQKTCVLGVQQVNPPPKNGTTASSVTFVVPISTSGPLVTSVPVVPNNGTVAPVKPSIPLTTATFIDVTTDAAGKPTSVTREVVGPAGPTSAAGPAGPSFTGAAAALSVPEFGSMRFSVMAGGIGLMGLFFAEF